MAKVLVSESNLTAIADAIRAKNGGSATYKPSEMATAIAGIETGGGSGETLFGLTLDNFLHESGGTLSEGEPVDAVLDGVTRIEQGAIWYNRGFRSLVAPDLASISNDYALRNAFFASQRIASADFTALASVSGDGAFSYAFYSGGTMRSASFPELVSVSGRNAFENGFYGCAALASVSFPKLETIGEGTFFYAFYGCKSLSQLEFPALTKIDCDPASAYNGRQFYFAANSGSCAIMRFPVLKEIYANGSDTSYGPFYYCKSLARIDLPALTTIGTHYTGSGTVSDVAIKNMFYGCASLKEIHFGSANQAAVEAMPGYDTLWGLGAGKATVYFDL